MHSRPTDLAWDFQAFRKALMYLPSTGWHKRSARPEPKETQPVGCALSRLAHQSQADRAACNQPLLARGLKIGKLRALSVPEGRSVAKGEVGAGHIQQIGWREKGCCTQSYGIRLKGSTGIPDG